MLPEATILYAQAIMPLAVAAAHVALGFFVGFHQNNHHGIQSRLFISYLALACLWNINSMLCAGHQPIAASDATWAAFLPYGMVGFGALFWCFGRGFLGQSWKTPWGWALGLAGLTLIHGVSTGWIPLQGGISAIIPADSTRPGFLLGTIWGAGFIATSLAQACLHQHRTQNPAHRNRYRYLAIAAALLLMGNGTYLFGTAVVGALGLAIAWLGSAVAAYIVVKEDLLDLGTVARRAIHLLAIVAVTVVVYSFGIYLIHTFLGDFIASSLPDIRVISPTLLAATVTAALLTIAYIPILRAVRKFTNRFIFGHAYDYQKVIEDYAQSVSSIFHLDELVEVSLAHIKSTLGLQEAHLWILDTETYDHFLFRILPPPHAGSTPLTLTKNTAITRHLATKRMPLTQYTIDISKQFRGVLEDERRALRAMNLECFVPILKKEKLIGVFALGTKTSQRSYTTEDMRLLATLADQTAMALENAGLIDRLQRNLEETTRMKNLTNNVLNSMHNGVVTIDLKDRITLMNKAAQTILGIPEDSSPVGQNYRKILPSLTTTVFPYLISNALGRKCHAANHELTIELPGRGQVTLHVTLTPLKKADDKTLGVTLVLDDLTKTKRLEAVHHMFRRYVSPAVVDRLPSDASELELGGHRQQVTVLFADIRGFTSFSEELEPEELVETLNNYLSLAASCILVKEGTLDKFMGDAVMAIFNAPLEQEDHVLRAVQAAQAMQQAIREYHCGIDGESRLSFGVGLHTGVAVVGNVGTPDRMDYTAIGDAVNLAKRIQQNAPGGKILMSEAVYEVIKDTVDAEFYQEMTVEGRKQPVTTYECQDT